MKELSLILIFVPIFLITSLNFYGGTPDTKHNQTSRAFSCTSCHPTIIDGILIGKEEVDIFSDVINIEINIPSFVNYNGVSVNIKGEKNEINSFIPEKVPYLIDNYGQLFALDISSVSRGKKENTIKIKYPISQTDKENGSIEIQGVLSNLDGQAGGEYSFYKKLEIQQKTEAFSLFPTVSNQFVYLNNLTSNSFVNVYNSTGKIVYSLNAQNVKESINVSDFPIGNYFVIVQNNKNISQSKFIVSK